MWEYSRPSAIGEIKVFTRQRIDRLARVKTSENRGVNINRNRVMNESNRIQQRERTFSTG